MLSELWDWIGENAAQLGIVVPLATAITFGGWALYKHFNQDSDTIDALNTALHRYEKQLVASELSIEERETKIEELSGALEQLSDIVEAGGLLAKDARALLDSFVEDPNNPDLLGQFDTLIQRYEEGSVAELISLYLGRGALSFDSDSQGALAAYTRVTQLDPNHMEAHNSRGHLLSRLGQMDEAEAAYSRVLELAKIEEDEAYKAAAWVNRGNIASTRGELDEAEQLYRQALEIYEVLDIKKGMAAIYGNLGNLAEKRGNLDEAETLYRQALEINEELDRKEGMAANHGNLGNLAEKRGQLDEARANWERARDLFAEIGMQHMVDRVQGSLDALD
jgi:tetratricopeptide (TPR) repeat protein